MITRIARILGSLAIAGLVVSACGGGAEPTATPRPTATAPVPTTTVAPAALPTPTPLAPTPTAAPKYGGILQVRAQFQPSGWDTYDSGSGSQWPYEGPLFSNLVSPNPYDESVLQGDLAEGWSIGKEGTEVTFRLRPNARWHDGQPVTVADIVYNLQRARAINPKPSTATVLINYMKAVTDVTAIDDRNVRVTLGAPSASFLPGLGVRPFFMYPAHIPFPDKTAQFNQNPVGTGPFQFKYFTLDQSWEWTRNKDYFKPGLPYLDGIHYTFIAPAESAAAAFRVGKFMASIWDSQVFENVGPQLERDQGFVRWYASAGRTELLFYNRPPFSDQRVRQAVSIGLDRKLILDVWLQGFGTTLASPLLPPELGGQWGLPASEMTKRPGFPTASPADVARAKELFKEAGVDPSTISIRHFGVSTFKNQGADEIIAAALAKLGFRVAEVNLEVGAGRTQKLLAGEFDTNHLIGSINFDDPLDRGGLGQFLFGQSVGKWSDPELDRLAQEQDRTLDVAKRKELISELQRRYLDAAYGVQILYRNYHLGYLPFVKNIPRGRFTFSPLYQFEQVWLDR